MRALDPLADLQLGVEIGYPPGYVMNSTSSPPAAVGVGDFTELQISTRASAGDIKPRPLGLRADIDKAKNTREKA